MKISSQWAILWFTSLITVSTIGYSSPILSVGSNSVNVGDIFSIPISVSGATDLQAFQFDLSYDNTKLNFLSFTDIGTNFEAAAIAGGGSLTGITGFAINGSLSGVADSMSGVSPGAGITSGIIAYISFQDIALGVSPLILSNVQLNFSDQGFSSINGQLSSVPEPNALALVCIGLIVTLCSRHIRNNCST